MAWRERRAGPWTSFFFFFLKKKVIIILILINNKGVARALMVA
jgi:hypothetical protein